MMHSSRVNMPKADHADASKKQANVQQHFHRRLFDFCLFGAIFTLGILILVVHLRTWGGNLYRETGGRWTETTCEIKGLYLHSRSDLQGITYYRPELQIEYTVNNKTYQLRTLNHQTLSPNQGFWYDYQKAKSLLKNYDRGMSIPCWYRADDPTRAVVLWQIDYWGWVFLIIPFALIALGGVGLIILIQRWSRSLEGRAVRQRPTSLYPTVPQTEAINESPGTVLAFRLPVVFFPVFQLFVAGFLLFAWNSLAWGIFLYLFSIRQDWCDLLLAMLFGIIFCGMGLLFFPWIISLFRSTLAVTMTILEISDHPVVPGRKHRLSLIQSGPLKAHSCEILIACCETAHYRQGTDTITNTREVYRQTLFFKEDIDIGIGQNLQEDFFLKLPIGVMHSLETAHNEIVWTILIEMVLDEKRSCQRQCPMIVLPCTFRSEH